MKVSFCIWGVIFSVFWEGYRSMNKKCLCNFDRGSSQLSCSFPPSTSPSESEWGVLSRPWDWCVEGNVLFEQVTSLLIVESELDRNFSLGSLSMFVNLSSLTLNRNHFRGKTLSISSFPPSYALHLSELDLGSNNLDSLDENLFRFLPVLTTLNVSGNELTTLPLDLFRENNFLKLIHIRDNFWNCTELEWFLDWLQDRPEVGVTERDRVRCWYRTEQGISSSTSFAHLIDECPGACKCRMERSLLRVDCRNLNLTSFPSPLPLHTGILLLDNNLIDSLFSLINATNYLHLSYLSLHNNSIHYVNLLDYADIFDGLEYLDLSSNRLTNLPTYSIQRLFTLSLKQVSLGNNPWDCECRIILFFHQFLLGLPNLTFIKDIGDIRCSERGPYHPNQPIVRLNTSICKPIINLQHQNFIVELVEIFLLVLIVSVLIFVIYTYVRIGQNIVLLPRLTSNSHYEQTVL